MTVLRGSTLAGRANGNALKDANAYVVESS
jgi:hypothetical protein